MNNKYEELTNTVYGKYPKDGTNCFFIKDGRISEHKWIEPEDSILIDPFQIYQRNVFDLGDCFRTREEANLELKRRKLMFKFNQFKNKCNGDWKPNFMNKDEYKYSITFFENKMICDISFGKNSFCQFGYFKNEEDCIHAIELFGAEIKELVREKVTVKKLLETTKDLKIKNEWEYKFTLIDGTVLHVDRGSFKKYMEAIKSDKDSYVVVYDTKLKTSITINPSHVKFFWRELK